MVAAVAGLLLLAGCGGGSAETAPARDSLRSNETPVATGSSAGGSDTVAGAAVAPLAPGSSVDRRPVTGRPLRVVFFGTSLTAGLGLDDAASEAWPAEIGRQAARAGAPIEVVNAGLSGETSAGAVRRIGWLLRDTADVVVVETGANDGLRGLPVAELEANLRAIVAAVRRAQPQAVVVLVAMEAPPNIGGAYASAFRAVYGRVAASEGVVLTPFLLDGVAGVPSMNQPDGIHPTPAGAARAARNVWPALARAFAARRAGAPAL